MSTSALYRRHLEVLDRVLADALARAARRGLQASGVLLHAGKAAEYHRDDREIVFVPTPHFARYVPLAGPDHCVLARPGKRPVVIRVAPPDYWYETAPVPASYWQDSVELAEVASLADVTRVTGALGGVAYLGNSPEAAQTLGIPAALVEPAALLAPLDWARAEKTEHEVALLMAASERAGRAHARARDAFLAGASEREVHWAFLEATGHLERELPYETIIAYDEKSATLHYQNKRGPEAKAKHTFLLDAGATVDGYASDITRTWVKPEADAVFKGLLEGLDAAQRDLVAMMTPGRPYLEIHVEAHRRTARLLVEQGLVRCSADEAFNRGVTRTFLPHGVGHHLGIQVHDVGGRQAGPDGGVLPPPAEYPYLRNTRTLAPGHVVTIEPGFYFVPMLLDALRATPAASVVDWGLVERLTPLGGIRIEDDVLCTAGAPRDLTRPHIAGPRGS
jgi:Xaa-Pro dipeptidase